MGRLATWIEGAATPSNIVMAGMAMMTVYNGALAYRNDTANEIAGLKRDVAEVQQHIDKLEKHNAAQEVKLIGRRQFMGCAVRQIDSIRRDTKTPAPCELRIEE